MAQYDWDPSTYLANMRMEVADYDRVQDELVGATRGIDARRILELGVGTGETSRRILAAHPRAALVGVDSSLQMLAAAREALAGWPVELHHRRLEDPLPQGPFELVVSAFAVHHLDGAGKAGLFERVAGALAPGGRLSLADVVVPADPGDAVIPLDAGYDLPSSLPEQISWLERAGLSARVAWSRRDLAVLVAERPA